MVIDIEKFERWIYSRFPVVKLKGNDDEYCIDSIFAPDRKQHLWVNPYKNAFHCWKSRNHGNVPTLFAKVEGCYFREARARLSKEPGDVRDFDSTVERLKARVDKIQKEKKRRQALLPEKFRDFRREVDCQYYRDCLSYLQDREIDPVPFDLGYCHGGDYEGGILLPVFDPDGSLIYWTIRMLRGGTRYRNPPKDQFSVTKEDVIWSGRRWQPPGSVVFLTEGIFDAMSLQICGVPAISILGRDISRTQVEMIVRKQYNVVLALDNDENGRSAEDNIHKELKEAGASVLGAVIPCGVKDWNNLLKKEGIEFLRTYIPSNIRQLDLKSRIKNLLSSL